MKYALVTPSNPNKVKTRSVTMKLFLLSPYPNLNNIILKKQCLNTTACCK